MMATIAVAIAATSCDEMKPMLNSKPFPRLKFRRSRVLKLQLYSAALEMECEQRTMSSACEPGLLEVAEMD